MSTDDTRIPSAIVSVGPTALGLRSAALVRRGLALAEAVERELWIEQRVADLDRKVVEGTIIRQEWDELMGDGPVGKLWQKKLMEGLRRVHENLQAKDKS